MASNPTDTTKRQQSGLYRKMTKTVIPPFLNCLVKCPNDSKNGENKDADIDRADPVEEGQSSHHFALNLSTVLAYGGLTSPSSLSKSKIAKNRNALQNSPIDEKNANVEVDELNSYQGEGDGEGEGEGESEDSYFDVKCGNHGEDDSLNTANDKSATLINEKIEKSWNEDELNDEDNEADEFSSTNSSSLDDDDNIDNDNDNDDDDADELTNKLNHAQLIHDVGYEEDHMNKIINSLTNNAQNLDELFEAEVARDENNSIRSGRKQSIIPVDLLNDLPSELTVFQKSVLENLKSNFLRDGIMMKVNDKDGSNKSTEIEEERVKLSLMIANKLSAVFELTDDDYFEGNFSAWLLKDVLLQGHIYLTRKNLLFFAFLPKRPIDDETPIQKGSLGMRTTKYGADSFVRTVFTRRFWAILHSETLSIYASTTDLYFPKLVIDLNTVIKIEMAEKSHFTYSGTLSPKNDFDILSDEELDEDISEGVWLKIHTFKKSYNLHCDNYFVARQWVNNITKVVFQLQNSNSNNEVLIKIPIEDLIDFRSKALYSDTTNHETPTSFHFKYNEQENSETLKEKMKKKFKKESGVDDSGVDEIFFILFNEAEAFEEVLNKVLKTKYQNTNRSRSRTISTLTSATNSIVESLNSTQQKQQTTPPSTIKKLGSFLTSPAKKLTRKNSGSGSESNTPPTFSRANSSDSVHNDDSLKIPKSLTFEGLKNIDMTLQTNQKSMDATQARYGNMFPTPMTSPLNLTDPSQYDLEPKKKQYKLANLGKGIKVLSNMSSMWSANPIHYFEEVANDPFYEKNPKSRMVSERNFHNHFALKYNIRLRASYYCYCQRSIPIFGKMYLGDTDLCFRSLFPGITNKMILPLHDIEYCKRKESHKISYYSLLVVIKNQVEVLFDFGSETSRDDCEKLILQQLERTHGQPIDVDKKIEQSKEYRNQNPQSSDSKKETSSFGIENARIKLFEDRLNSLSGLKIPIILEDSPFYSIQVRPNSSFKFTLLTIGSRGDVQPYISLALGLKDEGHIVTIATHIEFKEWVESFDIKFKEIAGNPTELMDLMVTHGGVSLGFLKEASAKFRSWISELLKSSWEACQDADVLIESPSAMGGVHIAEALGIPYFRAFTMPWTRTRAYPHAFIVPGEKKGGSYNYLSHVMFETVFWKGISSQVNRWRVEDLGIPRTNLVKLQQSKIPFLYNISPSIFPPALDFPDWVKVTGYWFLDESAKSKEKYEPPEALVEFMEKAKKDNKKLVYIGFGSIVVKDAKSMTKAIINAVQDADVRCILNKGWSDRLSKDNDSHKKKDGNDDNNDNKSKDDEDGDDEAEVQKGLSEKDKIRIASEQVENSETNNEFPPEIYNAGTIPHDWLFTKIDATVHHGGSGTTGASLRAGLPTVIKPFFGDQFFFATQIETLGVGIGLKKLNKSTLFKALQTVTNDTKMIEKAKLIGENIRQEDGVTTAIEYIYSELEYARNLSISKQNDYYKDTKYENVTPVVHEFEGEDEDEDEDEDELVDFD